MGVFCTHRVYFQFLAFFRGLPYVVEILKNQAESFAVEPDSFILMRTFYKPDYKPQIINQSQGTLSVLFVIKSSHPWQDSS